MKYSNQLLTLFLLCVFVSCNEPINKPIETAIKPSNISRAKEIYSSPDTSELKDDDWGKTIKYGLTLVKNTQFYIGPQGIVSKNLGNKMACTNCHLQNGTKPFGANFFNSHKTYPQYRAREDKILSLADRVNNCIERPHSGKPLRLDSKEMIAITSYIKWTGEKYDTSKHEGYGLKHIEIKDLASSSERGEIVYKTHCLSCHQLNGEGKMNSQNTGYEYPPLWGSKSYQEG